VNLQQDPINGEGIMQWTSVHYEDGPLLKTVPLDSSRASTPTGDDRSCPILMSSRASIVDAVITKQLHTGKLLPTRRSEDNDDNTGIEQQLLLNHYKCLLS